MLLDLVNKVSRVQNGLISSSKIMRINPKQGDMKEEEDRPKVGPPTPRRNEAQTNENAPIWGCVWGAWMPELSFQRPLFLSIISKDSLPSFSPLQVNFFKISNSSDIQTYQGRLWLNAPNGSNRRRILLTTSWIWFFFSWPYLKRKEKRHQLNQMCKCHTAKAEFQRANKAIWHQIKNNAPGFSTINSYCGKIWEFPRNSAFLLVARWKLHSTAIAVIIDIIATAANAGAGQQCCCWRCSFMRQCFRRVGESESSCSAVVPLIWLWRLLEEKFWRK